METMIEKANDYENEKNNCRNATTISENENATMSSENVNATTNNCVNESEIEKSDVGNNCIHVCT